MESNKEKDKNTHLRNGLRAIWRHLRPFKKNLAGVSLLGVVSALANGSVPYITGRFFDTLIGVSQHKVVFFNVAFIGSLPFWAMLLTVWAIIQLIANNIDWVMDRLIRRIDTDAHFKIQTDGFTHMFRLPMSYHKNAHTNGELQKISQAGWRVSAIVATASDLAPQFLSIIIGIVLAATINRFLALILIIGVIIYAAILLKMLLPMAALDAEAHKSWNESWDDAAASVQQIESVKQAAAENYEIKKVTGSLYGRTRNRWYRLQKHWNNVNFLQRTIVFTTQLIIFILSVKLISEGAITVGELVALNGYALMFFGPFAALGRSWQVVQNGITSAAIAEEIYAREEEVYAPQKAVSPERLSGEVRFQNVYFRYAPGQPEVLIDLDFTVKPGQSVALVGESGVGKSTAISLMSGYYFPEKGSVTIDGIDTRKLNLTNLRKQIAVVPQEVALFNDTIRANIRYGSFGASDEEVLEVAKEAHIDDFVATLPKGYDTLVGERGIKLSVGQKQRVAIARAMLRSPAILILDEPTSALDAATEKIVTEALERLMAGRTTFIIAHRLSTVRRADAIFVFEKGKIVETGTHSELIAKEGGVYRRLYEYQIGLH